ncbi:hypothetical protein B0J14DRAFT_605314 [Halenospora varia]|nr:hypothetical protein B0J14DRAFT_605314 [Halenospora varia]
MVVFKFLEPATTAFYKNDFEAITSFWKSRAKRHCDEIFKWNSWKCVICDKPAKDIVNVYLPQFHPHLEDADAPYKLSPEIVVIASPICFRGSTCDNEAEKVARGIAKGENEPEDDEEHFKKSCDNCGKISGLLACAGCRFTWYCSKECQVACWSVHKKGCKRTQRMMSAAL